MVNFAANKIIIHNNSVYRRKTEIQEHPEFENLATKNLTALFGDKVLLYSNDKTRIQSIAKNTRIPDALLLTGSNQGDAKLWLVEYELEWHNLDEHVSPQIIGFVQALKNPKTKTQLRDFLEERMNKDRKSEKRFQSILGNTNPLRFFETVIERQKGIILVFDKKPEDTNNLDETLEHIQFATGINSILLEYTPYENDSKDQIFLMDSLAEITQTRSVKREENRANRQFSAPTEDSLIKKCDESIKQLYSETKQAIVGLGSDIKIKPTQLYIAFTRMTNFLDIEPYKSHLKLFINMKSGTLIDPQHKARDVANIGHHGNGDYDITIKDNRDLSYILSLIKQSYSINSTMAEAKSISTDKGNDRSPMAGLSNAVKAAIRANNYGVFDISELKETVARNYPQLTSGIDPDEFYHSLRSVLYHLKLDGKIKKLDVRGHSGEYQQIADF